MEWLNSLRGLDIPSILFRIFLAMLAGGLLGIERGRKPRPAGLRTYMLVCLGSTLVMMTNQYVCKWFETGDPVRLGAQVVSGIGFLGAGTIITTGRNQVKGITTAAGLWAAACCGLAIGIGFYEGALVGCVAVFIVMAFMQKIDTHLHQYSKVIELYIEYNGNAPFSNFLQFARQRELEISDMQINKNTISKEQGVTHVVVVATSRSRRNHSEMLQMLSEAPDVQYIEEL